MTRSAIADRLPRPTKATLRSMVVCALTVVVLLALPQLVSLYWLRLLTNVLMLAVVAQGINAMAGFVGYPAFGNVVFFGIGAYGAGLAIAAGTGIAAALLAGALAASLVALVFGPLLLRLRGHYFAIATLGLNEVLSALASNLSGLTGGAAGLSLPLSRGTAAETALRAYLGFVALFVVSVALAIFLRDSRFGYGCRAIRANEEAAEATGVPTLRVKTIAWSLSAAVTAVAGGLYARWVGFIEPPLVFDMAIAVKGFVIFLLGGPGTVFGPLFGATLMESATTLAWSHLLKVHLLVLGVAIMIVVLFSPDGIQNSLVSRASLVRSWFIRGRR
jgi:branched-chain amino acid transport system permease protein